jgi:hypothetical protein
MSIVAATGASAIRSFVLPRSAPDRLSRFVFTWMRRLFALRMIRLKSYAERDRILAVYAPYTLLAMPIVWLTCVMLGYMLMFRALGVATWRLAFTLSGSSLLTLGFAAAADLPTTMLAFSEAVVGLILVALLISYLPTMYTAFARREAAVALLEVRAGSPPSAVEMILRYHRIQNLERMREQWPSWEVWFVDIEESHTSLAALVFFRSPEPHRSWITAAGTVLDAAALTASTLDLPRDPNAELCIRAGYIALRHIADFFRIPYDAHPASTDPISITRAEYDSACAVLERDGLRLKADREQAWRDFAGWRVNYDTVLLALATLTMAPPAPWSSDLAQRWQRPPQVRADG